VGTGHGGVPPDRWWWCPSNGHPTASFNSSWGTRQGGGGTALRVAVTTQANPAKPLPSGKIGRCTAITIEVTMAVPPRLSTKLATLRKKVAMPPDNTWWCTALHMAVCTITSGDSPSAFAQNQVQVGTALGVAVPPDKGVAVPPRTPPSRPPLPITATPMAVTSTGGGGATRAAPRAEFRLIFFTFFTTFANVLTLQVFHHHVQLC